MRIGPSVEVGIDETRQAWLQQRNTEAFLRSTADHWYTSVRSTRAAPGAQRTAVTAGIPGLFICSFLTIYLYGHLHRGAVFPIIVWVIFVALLHYLVSLFAYMYPQ